MGQKKTIIIGKVITSIRFDQKYINGNTTRLLQHYTHKQWFELQSAIEIVILFMQKFRRVMQDYYYFFGILTLCI